MAVRRAEGWSYRWLACLPGLLMTRLSSSCAQSLLMTLASQKGHLPLLKSVALHRNSIKGAPESFWAPLLKEVEPIRCTL